MNPLDHCFREDNCPKHNDHRGPNCCCCGESAEAHAGCDCEDPTETQREFMRSLARSNLTFYPHDVYAEGNVIRVELPK